MRKGSIVLLAGFLLICLLSSNGSAEDAETFMERFYDELADIIESNMDNPDECLTEVERFYENNQDRLSEFLGEAKRNATIPGISMEEQVQSVSDEEMAEMVQRAQDSKLYQIMSRYNQAVTSFIRKYPAHGTKIMEKFGQILEQVL